LLVSNLKLALKRYKWFLLILGVLVLAAVLRGLEVYTGNYVFLFDQGAFYLQVKRIVVERKPMLISEAYTPLPGFFQGPYFIYLLALPFLFLGGNPYWGMVVMFIIGLMAVLASYFLVKNLFTPLLAVFVAFIFAVYSPAIAASRMIWPPHIIYLLMPFYIFSLVKLFQNDQRFLFWAFLFASFISSFEIAAGAALYFPIVFYVLLIGRKMINFKGITLAIMGAIFPLAPQILFNFRHENIMLKGILSLLKGEVEAGTEKMDWRTTFFSHLQVFKENFVALFPQNELAWTGLFIFLAGLILFLFIKGNLSKKEKSFLFILVSFPLLVFSQLLFYRYILWSWYFVELQVVYIFLIGFLLAKLFRGKTKWLSLVAVLILLIKTFSMIHFMYTKEIYDFGGTAKVRGKLEAIDYIYQDAKGEEFNVLVFTPPIYDYPYYYLLSWYGEKKYGYVPGEEKKGTFYLWIEPDPQKPWTYKGWLETVIKTGKILKEKKLPSGFIIQKRYAQD